MLRIAILGWGSLIWDPRGLPYDGHWQKGGPTLPIEFSKISNDGRLTLVIDSQGGQVSTRYAVSSRSTLSDAICDLSVREGTNEDKIGHVATDEAIGTDATKSIIKAWAIANEFDAVVWTNLKPDFQKKQGNFSPEAARQYLDGLKGPCLRNAVRYIKRAPPKWTHL